MAEKEHTGLLPRFIGGRLIQPGESYDVDDLDPSITMAPPSTPVGNLTDEQLAAELRRRGFSTQIAATDDVTRQLEAAARAESTGGGANTDTKIAPVAPGVDPNLQATADAEVAAAEAKRIADATAAEAVKRQQDEDAQRQREADQAAADEASRAAQKKAAEAEAQRLANLRDGDNDSKPGGSLTKAQIAAELTDLKVEFDPNAKRDDLGKLLDAELAKPTKA